MKKIQRYTIDTHNRYTCKSQMGKYVLYTEHLETLQNQRETDKIELKRLLKQTTLNNHTIRLVLMAMYEDRGKK